MCFKSMVTNQSSDLIYITICFKVSILNLKILAQLYDGTQPPILLGNNEVSAVKPNFLSSGGTHFIVYFS